MGPRFRSFCLKLFRFLRAVPGKNFSQLVLASWSIIMVTIAWDAIARVMRLKTIFCAFILLACFPAFAQETASGSERSHGLRFGMPNIIKEGSIIADTKEHLEKAVFFLKEGDHSAVLDMAELGEVVILQKAGLVYPENVVSVQSGIVKVRPLGNSEEIYCLLDSLESDVQGYLAEHSDRR
jgi:hypothetical protein